jgi:Cu(I)/Ag(I) efflux system membrane protein CusA/SilA
MVGGLATSFLLELLVYPAIYFLWKRKEVVEGPPSGGGAAEAEATELATARATA